MRKKLLLFFLSVSSLSVYALNDYYTWAARFDDLEPGYEFAVLSQSGDTVRDAKAVVEIDKTNSSNKVLHVTIGSQPGYVAMPTPGKALPDTVVSRYPYLSVSVIRDNADTAAASAEFGLFFGKVSAYKNSGNTDFSAQEWKTYMFSPLKLEKRALTKSIRFGISAAGADYYIDDVCFMSSPDAFEREQFAIEKARRDSLTNAYMAEVVKMIDKKVAYDFEDYEVGTEFSIFPLKGKTAIEGAKAVVELDPKDPANKVLHITTPDTGGYVELDNPSTNGSTNPSLVSTLLKTYDIFGVRVLVSASDKVTANANFEITWGGRYSSNTKPEVAVSSRKWVENTFKLSTISNSLAKQMRIGFVAAGADYYIDDICFIESNGYSTDDQTKTARYWANKLDKNIGTCLNNWTAGSLGALAGNNFNMVVCENEMKFDATEPRRNQFSYNGGQTIVNTANSYGMKVRGHTLAWHGQNPSWVSDAINAKQGAERRQEAINILKNHIYNVVGHWKGQIAEWDVVNECLEENNGRAVGAGYSTRTWSVWYTGFGGEDYIDSAFVWAHQADPDAKLYINDYNIGHWGGGHYENGKTHAMYNLAKRLKDAGIPIDGVGMQTHTSVNGLQPEQIEETVKQFAAIGLNCIFTETDMPGGEVSGSGDNAKLVREISDAELVTQAEKYAKLVDISLRYDNCPTLVVWGVVDSNSWLDCSEGTKPLLFFADRTPHQAYIDVRKTYQKYAMVNEMLDVELISEDESDSDWFELEKTVDVYDITGRKIAEGVTMDYIYELPEGLYFVDGKKILVRE
ncbi:MAG: endo-1,4-beta-xylanase [Bacteroidaceae bacterium]|nr:endo-1,4-beta-xylanase [Bacteroidaceae bacterium]